MNAHERQRRIDHWRPKLIDADRERRVAIAALKQCDIEDPLALLPAEPEQPSNVYQLRLDKEPETDEAA